MRDAVVIFGGSGAIGAAILERYHRLGMENVVATYRHAFPKGATGRWVRFEARTDSDAECGLKQLRIAIAEACESVGAVFYCIGIPSTKRLVTETPADEWASLFAVNCLGFVRAYSAIREQCRAGRARVVVLSSDATRTVRVANGPYTASKAALESASLTLAREEASYGVRINLLAPSLVDSPLGGHVLAIGHVTNKPTHAQGQPWGRLLSVDEVADAALSLAVDDCWSYATGQVIRLAAGL